jgi:hypothetical protein
MDHDAGRSTALRHHLQSEIAAWSTRVNEKQRAVDWQFTIDKARGKLKRLYPKI